MSKEHVIHRLRRFHGFFNVSGLVCLRGSQSTIVRGGLDESHRGARRSSVASTCQATRRKGQIPFPRLVPRRIARSFSGGVCHGEVIAIRGLIVMAKGRLCVSFNSLIFGRASLEVSFLASFSFVGASDLSLYVFQSSCVSPYIITPPISASRKL
jgi:hypothetical protein